MGEDAPDFTLPGVILRPDCEPANAEYRLSEFRGEPVVLVFYPGDNTPVCTRQLNTYSAGAEQFAALDARLLAISPQSVASHEEFSCRQGRFAFPLLADEDKSVGEKYGVLGPLGFYRRSVFIIDPGGVVRYAHRAVAGLTFRPVGELVAELRALA